MDKKILYISISMVIIIIAFGTVMVKLISQNSECVANPLIYGANQFLDQGHKIECICSFETYGYDDFIFNAEEIGVIEEEPFWNVN